MATSAPVRPPPTSAVFVSPSEPTPHDVLPLTHGTVMAGLTTLISSHALVFRPHTADGGDIQAAAEIIKSGLAQVLVPYYPLAGRIAQTQHGWEVRCDGRGAVFIVTATPHDVLPSLPPEGKPVESPYKPSPPPPVSQITAAPALVVHITELGNDDGFILGVRVCNAVCDASGLIHFLSGWAEMARGERQVSVAPHWDAVVAARAVHPHPSHPQQAALTSRTNNPHPVAYPAEAEHDYVRIDAIDAQTSGDFAAKKQIHLPSLGEPLLPPSPVVAVRLDLPLHVLEAMVRGMRSNTGSLCTTSQILAAHVWRERVRALQIPLSAQTRLFFVSGERGVDATSKPLMGYYGAFKFNCVAAANAGDLLEMPLEWAADLVRKAQDSLTRAAFEACVEEFKLHHSVAGLEGQRRRLPPAEVLLFTELPRVEALGRQLDIGENVGRPHLAHQADQLQFPTSINIAAVGLPDSAAAAHPAVHIFFNNVPPSCVDALHSFVCNAPVASETAGIASKI